MEVLQEYSAQGIQIVPGSVVNNAVITGLGSPPSSLLDSNIQSTLQSWINNQNNQTPNFPQPSANTVYVLFLPQSVSVTIDDIPGNTGKSCASFGGYHWYSGSITYVVINCCLPPNSSFGSVLAQATAVCSHELAEVITDPHGTGWLDINTNPRDEIADICQGIGYPQLNSTVGNVPAAGGQTFAIQPIWSRTQNNCVFGPPAKLSAMALPDAVYGGQPVSGSVFLTELAPTLPSAGLVVSLSADNPVVQFNPSSVVISPGTLQASVSAATTAVQNAIVATVKATLGQQTIQQFLTVLPPSITNFWYAPGSAQGYQYPPNSPEGVLTLNTPAPAGGVIASIASSERLLVVPEPDELPIAPGSLSPSANFYLQVNPAGSDTPVTLTANVPGFSAAFTFKVLAGGPPNIVVKSLAINPPSVIGGTTTFGHFTLVSPVGPGGGSIHVASSDTTVATVQATVPLAAGATGGSFAIHTKALQQPIHLKHCTIEAGQQGPPAYALLTVTS
jgi:hypothetical protein